jgi:hypothetical protein
MDVNVGVHTAGMQIHVHAESTKQIMCWGNASRSSGNAAIKLFHLTENRNGSILSVKFSSTIISENLSIYSQVSVVMNRKTERERERERERENLTDPLQGCE